MGECLIMRRGGETYKVPVLNPNYPADVTKTVVKGNTTSAEFTVAISQPGNPAEYTYQWYVNDSKVSGATSEKYTKSDLSTTATYTVYCEVTNKAGTVKSRVATLKVTQYYTPVLNDSYPADTTVVFNTAVTSKVTIKTAGNPASYTYQWYKNGSKVSGETSSTYKFTPTAVGTTTVYCKVTNSAGTVTSRTATITATGVYLYKAGDEYTATTGGYELAASGDASYWKYNDIVRNTNNLLFRCTTDHSVFYNILKTVNTITLTNYKSIKMKVTAFTYSGGTQAYGYLTATQSTKYGHKEYAIGKKFASGTTGTISIDISTLSGKYYVTLGATFEGSGGTGNMKVTEVWLE